MPRGPVLTSDERALVMLRRAVVRYQLERHRPDPTLSTPRSAESIWLQLFDDTSWRLQIEADEDRRPRTVAAGDDLVAAAAVVDRATDELVVERERRGRRPGDPRRGLRRR